MAKKRPDWDDGRVVAAMTGDELPAYRRTGLMSGGKRTDKEKPASNPDLTRKERRAMIFAFYHTMLPRLLIIFAAFAITALFVWLWLR